MSGLGDAIPSDDSIVQPNQLALDIYVDETGKALLTGYAKDILGLPFLNSSDYRYNNDTGELYALTNSLTSKQGDNWTLDFPANGYYNQYHTTFFLPSYLKLRKINCSAGLEYLVYASNNSFIADIQGYDLQDPMTSIVYTLTLEEPPSNEGASSSVYLPIVLLVVMIICAAIIVSLHRRRSRYADVPMPETVNEDDKSGIVKPCDKQDEGDQYADITRLEDSLKTIENQPKSSDRKEIEVTREMGAVMETLTARERAVLQALIKNGGEMNQTELRYETSMPKSTLSGVLLSLERRKLITKKEWGRTNVIELSEWFLAKRN
ncbi:MAG: helix-turn-helix domain-containing protein [Methanotrichaceae archaeon]|nr:helix-turn-helix domain-containing protein [Methanotrichaceae archaeon]